MAVVDEDRPAILHQRVDDRRTFRIGKVDPAGLCEHQRLGIVHHVELPGDAGILRHCLVERPVAELRCTDQCLAFHRRHGSLDRFFEALSRGDVVAETL
jgi:hypothetical protein